MKKKNNIIRFEDTYADFTFNSIMRDGKLYLCKPIFSQLIGGNSGIAVSKSSWEILEEHEISIVPIGLDTTFDYKNCRFTLSTTLSSSYGQVDNSNLVFNNNKYKFYYLGTLISEGVVAVKADSITLFDSGRDVKAVMKRVNKDCYFADNFFPFLNRNKIYFCIFN